MQAAENRQLVLGAARTAMRTATRPAGAEATPFIQQQRPSATGYAVAAKRACAYNVQEFEKAAIIATLKVHLKLLPLLADL